MKKMILPAVLVAVMLPMGCFYDNEEDLYGTPNCNLDNVTYSATVLPILQNRCYTCHQAANNQGGGIVLEGYDGVKFMVDNNKLLGAIRHEACCSPMPKGLSKLPDCEIQKIEKWVELGALDN